MNTPSPRRNPAASVRQRLLNRARQTGEDFNLVLTRYAVERLLFRLSQSRYRSNFILKGAMLLAAWRAQRHRPTGDLDLTGYGSDSAEELTAAFREIVELPVEPDGLQFDRDGITVSEIREDQEYHGKRVVIPARLGTARIKVQVDIGFGDVVIPEPQELSFPTLLGSPSPRIRAYPPEAVIAEKFHAMVRRYNLKGKRHLETNAKYYLGDIGLRNGVLGYREADIGGLLENLVYLELRRRGYRVAVGSTDAQEIDFVAEDRSGKVYIQAAYLLETRETIARELRPFALLDDAYPRYLLTLDPYQPRDLEGVRHRSVQRFLLCEDLEM